MTRSAVCLMSVVVLSALLGGASGCGRSNLGRAIQGVKELEPDAKKRNDEIRELSGAPAEKNN